MHDAVHACVVECNWKLRALMRTRRFHTVTELVQLYKAHILSFADRKVPAARPSAGLVSGISGAR
eukprot:13841854-Alexandrium_andersonii.AAC.1